MTRTIMTCPTCNRRLNQWSAWLLANRITCRHCQAKLMKGRYSNVTILSIVVAWMVPPSTVFFQQSFDKIEPLSPLWLFYYPLTHYGIMRLRTKYVERKTTAAAKVQD